MQRLNYFLGTLKATCLLECFLLPKFEAFFKVSNTKVFFFYKKAVLIYKSAIPQMPILLAFINDESCVISKKKVTVVHMYVKHGTLMLERFMENQQFLVASSHLFSECMLNSFKITRGGGAAIQTSYFLIIYIYFYELSWPLVLFIEALKALYMCHHIDYVGGSCTLFLRRS